MKFLIMLPYYNRPDMVRFAIDSVLSQDHQDWELVICDDESDYRIEAVLQNYQDHRISFLRNRYKSGEREFGSTHGAMMNVAAQNSKAEVAIILCDDDALYPGYLSGLAEFYKNHPEIHYSYGHVSIYDPTQPRTGLPVTDLGSDLNHMGPINPVCQVDASQVSWRLTYRTQNIFPKQQTAALDASVFGWLHELYGPAVFNGLVAQYKGWFWDQMGRRLTEGHGVEPRVQ